MLILGLNSLQNALPLLLELRALFLHEHQLSLRALEFLLHIGGDGASRLSLGYMFSIFALLGEFIEALEPIFEAILVDHRLHEVQVYGIESHWDNQVSAVLNIAKELLFPFSYHVDYLGVVQSVDGFYLLVPILFHGDYCSFKVLLLDLLTNPFQITAHFPPLL